MTNVRSLSASAVSSASPSGAPATTPGRPSPPHSYPHRQRLRAVAPDEVPPVAELLHPGATWLPAPAHTLPTLPGQPPMVGYLVLVPAADTAAASQTGQAGQIGQAGEGGAATGDELVRIDPDQRTAQVAGRPLDLTYLEFELLAHLVAHPHRVHTRDQLVTTVWGYGHVGDGRTVDVHVARLRRKMGAEHRGTIVTVRRVGYKYVPTA
ncbi:winged helix-turn-helix domain-containing protein [Streptomyces sp. ME19-01-6]|uniref:winged helix-turn-helix domain-containing protein n=1 Tax=Streptomyces sp. ME19-01-6 TaxID=3028686 RepID=UPI0029AE6510|nr:winged helix-turn-helix domain-containing protein [Streptomyces sp. ME19-01-6]MDX3232639.1 winged helix-turn-helix domain-containing protein [Streptomyces sp. ME19-01-6]